MLIYSGKDQQENRVFLLGRKKEKRIVCQALMGFTRIFSSREKMVFFDLSNYNNFYLKLATYIYKLNKLIFIKNKSGDIQKKIYNWLVFKGIEKEYPRLLHDIRKFSNKLKYKNRHYNC